MSSLMIASKQSLHQRVPGDVHPILSTSKEVHACLSAGTEGRSAEV